ncbi:hypothetical protein [Catenuloplanes japonicus]|uniref:hypothetical protein n=1 Tax=Catenuloplanes japonicus TaxID=33876 RepID=UPI0012FBDA4B|nr:hypothetical protein [Catenuloplanes japonicus]
MPAAGGPAVTASLLAAAAAGDHARVLTLLSTMDDAARRAAARPLTAAFRALPAGDRSSPARERFAATEAAALGCQPTPATAAAIIARMWRHSPGGGFSGRCLPVLAGRDPAWLGDLAHRLAATMRVPRVWSYPHWTGETLLELTAELVRRAGCAVPTGDGYVALWGLEKQAQQWSSSDLPPLPDDPYTPELLPRLLDLDGFGRLVEGDRDGWTRTVAGALDRGTLLDRCAGRLLTGGRPAEMRGYWKLIDAVAPTEDELAAMTADWARLTATADSPVATRAQAILRQLRAAGRLDTATLGELSRDVLLRPERTLVRAQLRMLADALPELLPVVAVAFGNEDSVLQEHAWRMVAPHAGVADDEVRAAVALLVPDLAARASAVLGVSTVDTAVPEMLPPVSSPRRVAPAPESPVELAQEVAALIASRDEQAAPSDRERVLDGLVRHAYRDREKLVAELRHATRGGRLPPDRIHLALAAVLDGTAPELGELFGAEARCGVCAFDETWTVRVHEAAVRIVTDPVPYLLATPGYETGAIDADELLDRLTGYARDGVRAGHADLDQALLRVRRPDDPDRISAAATALGTPDAARFARWWSGDDDGFSGPFTLLGAPLSGGTHWHPLVRPLPRWLAVLPVHRENLAVLLHAQFGGALDPFWRDLPLLAEADGPAGPALDALLAKAIGRAGPDATTAVVDALLQLAARGDLDAARCGGAIGGTLPDYMRWSGTPVQAEAVLGEAARAGAHATVWAVLAAALPGLIAHEERRYRFHALLSLAADCAARSGATGVIPGLDALAGSGGSSQVVKQARRLRDLLI